MLHIVECSGDEKLSVLQHGKGVFHDALALVKKGESRFHVSRDDGEDYDLQYTKNMDLFPKEVKSFIMTMTEGKDLHPLPPTLFPPIRLLSAIMFFIQSHGFLTAVKLTLTNPFWTRSWRPI